MSHVTTPFNEILHLIPRHVFQKLERRHACGRKSRQFGFREQFTVMAFVMLAASRSLRDALASLKAQGKRLYHWGLKNVCRSTVSDANRTRPCEFFEDLFREMCAFCALHAPRHQFPFKNKIFSVDSTVITLSAAVFKWAAYRSSRNGVKIHTVLDHDGHIPAFATITEAKKHDSKFLEVLELPKGSFVIVDRAYSALKWFSQMCKNELFFVTRMKKDMKFKLIEKQAVDPDTGVTSDHVIEMGAGSQKITLRKIGYYAAETGKHYVFLSNNFALDAKTLADLYKSRWQIEIFFKEIKQFLKIKKFIGTNENAVKIQIYTALTVYLLLAMQKFLSKIGFSIGQIFQLIQLNLVGFRSIEDLLIHKPDKTKSSYDNSLLAICSI